MDGFTLVVAAALTASTMAASMGLLYLASVRQPCLADWGMAAVLFALSNVTGAVGLQLQAGPATFMVFVAFVNAFHVGGHLGMLAGVRRHLHLAPGWGWGWGAAVAMTVSVGVAALDARDDKWEDVLQRADEALYHAKQHGRNRVSVHGRDLAGRGRPVHLQVVRA
jgi:Diguanylate cyclase, GGDEF domain